MLYVVGTPIGNLDDITLRALRTLENADLIAAEDTRHTMSLLEHFGLKKPVISYFEHNKMSRGPEIVRKLKEGTEVALVSDAGMPGICDPGYELIRDSLAEGIEVTVIPGPSACVTALVLSGLPTDGFVFAGFIGTDNRSRRAFFDRLLCENRTTVCYEAPHRILKTLSELSTLFAGSGTPERRIALCRELTKVHEEVVRGTAAELLTRFEQDAPRGEFVVCIEGAKDVDRAGTGTGRRVAAGAENCPDAAEEQMREFYSGLISSGALPKEAMKQLQEKYGISRNEAYRIVKLPDRI